MSPRTFASLLLLLGMVMGALLQGVFFFPAPLGVQAIAVVSVVLVLLGLPFIVED